MPYIWQLTAIQLDDKTWICGTALEGKQRKHRAPRTVLAHFTRILGSYFKTPYGEQLLTVEMGDIREEVQTTEKGFFSVLVDAPLREDLNILVKGERLALPDDYPLLFPEREEAVEVVSDIDDTILLSHTASFFKRIGTILFRLPQKRKTVLFTNKLLKQFHSSDFRVSYLSKSESNLFELISGVLSFQELPEGALFLTPHLKLRQLFSDKEKDYKLLHLQRLMENLPHKRFILLGDDTQRDMDVYTHLVRQYQDRIVKVYIRQTRRNRSSVQQAKWEQLLDTGVAARYFEDSDEAASEIQLLKEKLSLDT